MYPLIEKKKEVKMTIRKLTVAAAIAVGIATCSFNTVMAALPLRTAADYYTNTLWL